MNQVGRGRRFVEHSPNGVFVDTVGRSRSLLSTHMVWYEEVPWPVWINNDKKNLGWGKLFVDNTKLVTPSWVGN